MVNLASTEPQAGEPVQLSIVPLVVDPAYLLRMNQEFVAAHPEMEFPQTREPALYNKTLLGVPFAIVSEWLWKKQPASVYEGITFPARDVIQVMLATVSQPSKDPTTWAFAKPRLATLSGAYLLNQFRDATPNTYIGAGLFTIARNPAMPLTPQGEYPMMLARYDVDKYYQPHPDENAPF